MCASRINVFRVLSMKKCKQVLFSMAVYVL